MDSSGSTVGSGHPESDGNIRSKSASDGKALSRYSSCSRADDDLYLESKSYHFIDNASLIIKPREILIN